MKQKISNSLVTFILLLLSASAKATVDFPRQFDGTNSAVILGLDTRDHLEITDVKTAARALLNKFHPDRFSDTKLYSDQDRKKATEVSQKISEAKNALIKYLQVNPNYTPRGDQFNDFQGQGGSNTNKAAGASYSWDDVFQEHSRESKSGDIVTSDYYGGASLNGTMFEFLQKYPQVNQAFLYMEGRSPDLAHDQDVIIVIEPKKFPIIEFRFISKKTGSSVQKIKSVFAQYVRGKTQGQANIDAFVLPNGNYFMNISYRYKRDSQVFDASPMDNTNETKVMLKARGTFYLIELADGYSLPSANSFITTEKKQEEILPLSKPARKAEATLGWKEVKAGMGEVILLDSRIRSCKEVMQ